MIVRAKDATAMQCGRYNGMCRGDACMQFRRMDSGGVPGADARESVGFCGLGGRPTVMALHEPTVKVQRGMPSVEHHDEGLQPQHGHITPRTRAMERLILQGPDGGKFFEAAEVPGDGGKPVVVVTPAEAAVLHGSCGECAGDDCHGCVGG